MGSLIIICVTILFIVSMILNTVKEIAKIKVNNNPLNNLFKGNKNKEEINNGR